MIGLVPFEDLNPAERLMVLEWRNHPAVRAFMYTDTPIAPEAHLAFVESLKNRIDKRYFLVRDDHDELGVIDLCNISNDSGAIGLYANPYLSRYGAGTLLMEALIGYASGTLHLKRLRAECFADNTRAKHLYQKFDFKEISRTFHKGREVIIMERTLENR